MSSANFADRLINEIRKKKSRVVVGLDPNWEHLPQPLKEMAMAQSSMTKESYGSHMWAIREFCEQIIAATDDVAVAFKPQVAFFERYGYEGMRILERLLIDHEGKLFILDCKRGDIGSTSEAYARAYFNHPGENLAPLACDAVTHNPFLGYDSLKPYFDYLQEDKGMFLLCKTSNPSAKDLQDLEVDGKPLYLHLARKIEEWGTSFIGEEGFSSLGMVVGGTQPETGRRIREVADHSLMLVPGMNTQGGKLDDAKAFCDSHGMGAVFNFSRSVIFAHKFGPFNKEHPDERYAEAARIAAEHNRVKLNDVLGEP